MSDEGGVGVGPWVVNFGVRGLLVLWESGMKRTLF